MTRQTIGDLFDDAKRLHPDVVAGMREKHERDRDSEFSVPWEVEYEIPAETNGWIYRGNPGALSTTHDWVDDVSDPTEAVVVHHTPTHPLGETPDMCEASYLASFDTVTRDAHDVFFTVEGEPYRTPLYTRRRMFWEAVEAAIEYMEDNPPR